MTVATTLDAPSVPLRATGAPSIRPDLKIIADLVAPRSRVLDIGCGDGELLHFLTSERGADARGMELSQTGVNACVRRGLSVIQGDADNDLDAYPAGAFDYVILSQTLQATRQPRKVLETLARIGKRAIISVPNFGHWRVRLALLFGGRMPRSALLEHTWYDTPNIHLCTVLDFLQMTKELGISIERALMLDQSGLPLGLQAEGFFANLFAAQAVFLLRRDES